MSYKFNKTDRNHVEVCDSFRDLGWSVTNTHMVKGGFGDAVVSKNNFTAVIEIKDGLLPPSARKLTKQEQEFSSTWKGIYAVITSIEDVINFNSLHS